MIENLMTEIAALWAEGKQAKDWHPTNKVAGRAGQPWPWHLLGSPGQTGDTPLHRVRLDARSARREAPSFRTAEQPKLN